MQIYGKNIEIMIFQREIIRKVCVVAVLIVMAHVNSYSRIFSDSIVYFNSFAPAMRQDTTTEYGRMAAHFSHIPAIAWTGWAIKTFVGNNGYIVTNRPSKFDFGPMNTILSHNDVEGYRVRLGGMTTANLNKQWFGSGYVAYGFHDKKVKYSAEVEYSFNPKRYRPAEYPMKALRLSHSYDVNRVGSEFYYSPPDNIRTLFNSRFDDDKISYQRKTKLVFEMDLSRHLSVMAGFSHIINYPSESIAFIDGYGNDYRHYIETPFMAALKVMDFTFVHEYVPRRLFGSKYTVNKSEIYFSRVQDLGEAGCLSAIVKTGKLWSASSFVDMPLPNANLRRTMQDEMFSLMRPMEFLADQYLQWDIDYSAEGLLFNRIPLVNKLRFHEVVSFKGYWGKLTDTNNPDCNYSLLRILKGRPIGSTPYMEFGVGVGNILGFLRIEYIWRLTYRNEPGAMRGGIGIKSRFSTRYRERHKLHKK